MELGSGHGNGMASLRLILASMVILGHGWWVLRGNEEGDPISFLTRGATNTGGLAVDAFFVLSGLLVSWSWARSASASEFLLRRALRIYPAFAAVCLLQAFVLVPIVTQDWRIFTSPAGASRVLLHVLTLGGAGAPYDSGTPPFADLPFPQLNASLWTLRCEFICYLLLALWGSLGILRNRVARLLLFATAVATYAISPDWDWHELLKGIFGAFWYWPRFVAFFTAGMCLQDLRAVLVHWPRARWWATLALAASAAHPIALRVALPTIGAVLLGELAFSRPLTRLAQKLPGDFSYGIYLYGFPVQQLMASATGTAWNPWAFGVVCTVATTFPAALSWWCIEKPALRLKSVLSRPA